MAGLLTGRACGRVGPDLPIAILLLAGLPASVGGAEPAAATAAAERFAVHGQVTYTEQESDGFHEPYRGPYSLSPNLGRETTDVTLFVGARLWRGAEAWLNGEIDEGFGLDDTVGVAGFPSAEAYKVGRNKPYLRLPRAFVRQTWNVGDASEPVEAAANQLAGAQSADRVVLTIGKFGVPDVFDTSQYAHDPRADFLNWTAVDAGSFDYAADAWAYTVGASLEWYQGPWTLRGGWFDLSTEPNSTHLDPGGHEFQLDAELEHRHAWRGRPGRILITAYDTRGRMALLDAAVARAEATGRPIDLAAVRQYRSRTGAHLTFEQQLTDTLGLFGRAGGAGGNVEAYEFTDVDRSASLGLSLKGSPWHRADDTVGLVAIENRISATRERYFNAGGLGILVGDGRLPHPGPENIVETYYSLAVLAPLHVTFDYQWIGHPGYNTDRGPVSVFALRVHAQF